MNIAATTTLTKTESVWPFFDKVAVWLRRPASKTALAELKKQCGHLHVGNHRARFDGNFRQRLELKQPTDAALRWLAARDDALINQIEVALDFIFGNWADRDDAYDFLNRHLVRRWHGKRQEIRVYAGKAQTRYDGPRAARNSLVLYRQEFSRVTGELCAVHFEWRLRGARAVRGAGISSGQCLLKFDHRAFWERRLLLCDIEPERLGRYLRNQTEGSKSRVTGKLDSRTGHVVINGCSTVQEIIDRYSRLRIQRVMTRLPVNDWLPASTLPL
jgi:hypothetical protein